MASNTPLYPPPTHSACLTANWFVMLHAAPYPYVLLHSGRLWDVAFLSGMLQPSTLQRNVSRICFNRSTWPMCPLCYQYGAVTHAGCTVLLQVSTNLSSVIVYGPDLFSSSPLLPSLFYAWLSIIHSGYYTLFRMHCLSSRSYTFTSVFPLSMWVICISASFPLSLLYDAILGSILIRKLRRRKPWKLEGRIHLTQHAERKNKQKGIYKEDIKEREECTERRLKQQGNWEGKRWERRKGHERENKVSWSRERERDEESRRDRQGGGKKKKGKSRKVKYVLIFASRK